MHRLQVGALLQQGVPARRLEGATQQEMQRDERAQAESGKLRDLRELRQDEFEAAMLGLHEDEILQQRLSNEPLEGAQGRVQEMSDLCWEELRKLRE